MYVSYNFKTALDYSSIYRSIHFWYHDTTLEKIFSKEKLNLTGISKSSLANFILCLPPTSPQPLKKVLKILTPPPILPPPTHPPTRTHILLKLTPPYFWVDIPGWGQGMGTEGGGSGWWGFHHHSRPLIFKYF